MSEETSDLRIFSPDVDESRVVSVTVGELRKLHMDSWNAAIDDAVGNHGKFDFASERITVRERTCHLTDCGEDDYGTIWGHCSECGSPIQPEHHVYCPSCGARVIDE